jgi:Golgi nucleoside diphosphatase
MPCEERYAIVVDAGSTGTRAFVFKLDRYEDGRQIVHSYSCGKARYGLSAFADRLEEAHEMFHPLLQKAAEFVPVNFHRKTPLYVKGTAGMRLLEEDRQEKLWSTLVRDLKHHSKFRFNIQRENFGTISGHFEAFYAVIASNYIIGSIDGNLRLVFYALTWRMYRHLIMVSLN